MTTLSQETSRQAPQATAQDLSRPPDPPPPCVRARGPAGCGRLALCPGAECRGAPGPGHERMGPPDALESGPASRGSERVSWCRPRETARADAQGTPGP